MTRRAVSVGLFAVLCSAAVARADDRAPGAVQPSAQSDFWNQRTIGAAIAVGGGVVDVAALLLGAHAMTLRNDARDAGCRDDLTHCPASALPTADAAYSSAKRATVLFAVGTLAVGAGIYVRLTAPRAHAVSLSPALGPDAAGAALTGTF